jgi:glutathione peroxidase
MLPILICCFMNTLFPTPSLYDFTLTNIDGDERSLAAYSGKVVMVVNVASMCGYTPQYEQLEQIYEQYRDRGFEVLAFPANDFGAQEPGTDAEIKEFCTREFGVTFPLFSKITVKGPDKHPLYAWLTSGGGRSEFGGEIPWNFEKFLVDRNGHVVARFHYKVRPDAQEVLRALEEALQD